MYFKLYWNNIVIYEKCEGSEELKRTLLHVEPGVTSINEGMFNGNENLVKVIIPPRIKSIGLRAFAGCTELKEVSFGGVRDIAPLAFGGCDNLEVVSVHPDIVQAEYRGLYGSRYFRERAPYEEMINAMQAGCQIELQDKNWVDPNYWD